MPKSRLVKKDKKSLKILPIAIPLFSIAITLVISLWNSYAAFNTRLKVFLGTTFYNNGILNTLMASIKDETFEQKIFSNSFNIDIYKNNLDLLGSLQGDCVKPYLQLIALMDSVNRQNDKVWDLYTQEGLIFETNQWKNTKERQESLKNDLKSDLLKVDSLFKTIGGDSNCAFRTKNFLGIFSPGL